MNNFFNEGYIRDTSIPNNKIDMPLEQSYIENLLRLNKGKKVKVLMSFSDSVNHRDKVFEGIIRSAGRDHIVLEDTENNKWYMLLMIYLDYVEFNENIIYKI